MLIENSYFAIHISLSEALVSTLRGLSQLSTFSQAYKPYAGRRGVNSNVKFFDIINNDRTFLYETHYNYELQGRMRKLL